MYDLEAIKGVTPTDADISGALADRQHIRALNLLVALMTSRALVAMREADERLSFYRGPEFEQELEANLTGVVVALAQRARRELDALEIGRPSIAADNAEAAVRALEAVSLILARVAPIEDERSAELVILGCILGSSEVFQRCAIDQLFSDARAERILRDRRQAGAAVSAQKKNQWHDEALALSRQACAKQPWLSSARIAQRLFESRITGAPDYPRLLAVVGTWRRNGDLPQRVKGSR
ncbi:MAG TPA: hypothetical protein VNR51_00380 [Hyphomicrobium sp.]|nr:hypothetical protein [Hyphomicrobium sp.]